MPARSGRVNRVLGAIQVGIEWQNGYRSFVRGQSKIQHPLPLRLTGTPAQAVLSPVSVSVSVSDRIGNGAALPLIHARKFLSHCVDRPSSR